jgi:hypothetical protein
MMATVRKVLRMPVNARAAGRGLARLSVAVPESDWACISAFKTRETEGPEVTVMATIFCPSLKQSQAAEYKARISELVDEVGIEGCWRDHLGQGMDGLHSDSGRVVYGASTMVHKDHDPDGGTTALLVLAVLCEGDAEADRVWALVREQMPARFRGPQRLERR